MSKGKKDQNDLERMIKQGIVTKVFSKQSEILIGNEEFQCAIPKSCMVTKNSIGVGDWVEVEIEGPGKIRFIKVLDRKTSLYRGNRKVIGEDILVAANMDQVIVVVTAEYLVNQTGYIEEAVIAARRADIGISLYISKWDMVNEQVHRLIQDKLVLYQNVLEHIFISLSDVQNTEFLKYLRDKITLFVGDRASGKSTLIQKICCQMEERELEGKLPSTNAVELISCGNMKLIDTAGFRNFALQKITQEELSIVFDEIGRQEQKCEFRNCTHTHEEQCGVLEAMKEKQIRRDRYLAYQQMRGTITESKEKQKIDYRKNACTESFVCKSCGKLIVPEGAGSQHRNHCPYCLCSLHVDHEPGDRASLCHGIMKPIGVWVRNDGEWAIIHRCSICGALSSNRIAADDNPIVLMSIAVKPLSRPPFPLDKLEMKL